MCATFIFFGGNFSFLKTELKNYKSIADIECVTVDSVHGKEWRHISIENKTLLVQRITTKIVHIVIKEPKCAHRLSFICRWKTDMDPKLILPLTDAILKSNIAAIVTNIILISRILDYAEDQIQCIMYKLVISLIP
jgi:hypothetical protein